MKKSAWFASVILALTALSFLLYFLQYYLFHRTEDTFFYMLQDTAFLPVQVLLVTVILNALMNRREKSSLLSKMNMVIGAFFSEVGMTLLHDFSRLDLNTEVLRSLFTAPDGWSGKSLAQAKKAVMDHRYRIQAGPEELEGLQRFLVAKRSFLVGLLENSNLLEHESFTEMLWAVFHLAEELSMRTEIRDLPATDLAHLAGDITRAYRRIVLEWIDYVTHLKKEYPYIFSLVRRVNPFNPDGSPIVRSE
jgi:hypothetical protein